MSKCRLWRFLKRSFVKRRRRHKSSGVMWIKFCDMGNGFSLVKFANEVDCNKVFEGQPWFVGSQVYSLPRWKKDFDPIKEKLLSALPWFWIPRLSLELWSESALDKILHSIGKVYEIDNNSEVISKCLFAHVCLDVDIVSL